MALGFEDGYALAEGRNDSNAGEIRLSSRFGDGGHERIEPSVDLLIHRVESDVDVSLEGCDLLFLGGLVGFEFADVRGDDVLD